MPDTDGRNSPKPTAGDAAKPEAFGRGEHRPVDPQQKESQDTPAGEGQKAGDNQNGKQQDKKPFWKRPVLLSVMVGVALAAIIAGTWYLIHAHDFESTDDAFIDGRISHISPRVAGKVLELRVNDNQIVTADQPLILIDPEPYIVKLHQSEGALAQAQAQLQQSIANLEVSEANALESDADVKVAQANAHNARQNYERFLKIQPAARSQQQLDNATADQSSSDAQVTAAEKKADAMHAQVLAAEKTRDASEANVKSAQAQKEQAELDLSYCTVIAGHAGRVTRRTVEVGNYVSVGQEIMDVVGTAVPQDIWVTANFKETQLAKMERGQPVTISVDSFPDEKLHGRVDSIQNGTGAVFSLLPPENATGNYVKVVQRVPVKIILDGQPCHMLSPGMSVEPEVDVRDHRQAGDGEDSNASNSPTRP
jgi:membrane fusion protein (multidrug efflux system)